jgi:GDP/UDP-N,N'-diacetylbacillosamine 2-epimerase (hydrolysing)
MSQLMNRKICVITGSRADYGLLRWVMQGIKDDPELTLQVIATGMHLSSVFGMTYRDIEEDGFHIDASVEILLSEDTPLGIAESIASGISGCAKAFDHLKPDIILVLGDRFEIFAAATSALVTKIPVAHIHGGESTVGAFDEAFRHSITKMSQVHFVATEEYRRRVIQLGENPMSVNLVGGLGIENINRLKLLGKEELEISLGIKIQSKSLLITYHPVTLENESTEQQMKELLTALSNLNSTTLIFTMPNADTGGSLLTKMIEEFTRKFDNAYAFQSLGQLRYLSCIAQVDGVVGNSSSGLTEVPSFKKGTINIGTRQRGRLQALSVINCPPEAKHISDALKKLYSEDFRSTLDGTINPYGEGDASNKVVKVLKNVKLTGIVQKTFYDL